ncbi:HK97 family phage prohead protease [Glutamicibacter sp. NPDC087673]|uniref:HK97 family phage prohead protease n=1 Tax=Glutamicibacter sp. NPDC087673 TaxID=3363997 RepID=UPI00382C10E5
MSNTIKLSSEGSLTLAIAPEPATVDMERRTVKGKIAAYNKTSTTARIRLAAGSLRPRMPLRGVKMLIEHDMKKSVGYMLSYDPDTLEAEFKIPEGPEGDEALKKAADGTRDGLSIGVHPEAVTALENGDRQLDDGELYEVSLVAVPDFADARVQSVTASVNATDRPTEKEKTMDLDEKTPAPAGFGGITLGALLEHGPDAFKTAGNGPALKGFPTGKEGVKLGAVESFRADLSSKKSLSLALDPIIQSDVYDATSVPQFVGELWAGRAYVERFAPLTTARTLTSQKIEGWGWEAGFTPDVGDYEGNLTEVPTNEVKAKPVSKTAARLASGHKVDRIHVDMPNGGFWESFYRERAKNYARKRDAKVLAHMRTAGNHTAKTVALGVDDPWAKLVRGALWVLEVGVPQWAILGADEWEKLALTVDSDKLAYLNASLGLEAGQLADFKLVPAPISDTASNGRVTVGVNEATEFYELPGGPIRVDALDVSNGGVDAGLFGYYGLLTTDARGVVDVTTATA